MADINIVPLVDVLLVILIIFMVTAPLLYRGMEIQLPAASTNTIKAEQRKVLTIDKDQTISLDDENVGLVQLEDRLVLLRENDPDVSLYLRADQTVPYGVVVQVMDRIKKAGIENLGMVTVALDTVTNREREK